jgi:hypothetical protein
MGGRVNDANLPPHLRRSQLLMNIGYVYRLKCQKRQHCAVRGPLQLALKVHVRLIICHRTEANTSVISPFLALLPVYGVQTYLQGYLTRSANAPAPKTRCAAPRAAIGTVKGSTRLVRPGIELAGVKPFSVQLELGNWKACGAKSLGRWFDLVLVSAPFELSLRKRATL